MAPEWTDSTRYNLDLPEDVVRKVHRNENLAVLGRAGKIERRATTARRRVRWEYNVQSIIDYYEEQERK